MNFALSLQSSRLTRRAFRPLHLLLFAAVLVLFLFVRSAFHPGTRPGPPQAKNQGAVTEDRSAGAIQSGAVSRTGLLAVGRDSGAVEVWDPEHSKRVWKFDTAGPAYPVIFSDSGELLAAGGQDGIIKIWNIRSGQETAILKQPTEDIHSLAFSPDARQLASGSYQGIVKVWDLQTRKVSHQFSGASRKPSSAAWSTAGSGLAVGRSDHGVWLIRPAHSAPEIALRDLDEPGPVAYSSSGILAAASPAGRIQLAVPNHGILSLDYGQTVDVLQFSPDGRRLAAGGGAPGVLIWDTASGKLQASVPESAFSRPIGFSPDGRTLYTDGDDSIVQFALPR